MSDDSGWPHGQRVLHWASAALVVLAFILAWIMVAVPFRPLLLKFTLYQAHKTAGLLVLALTVVRLLLRATRARPPWEETLSLLQRRLAVAGHAALYGLLLVVPVLGYFVAVRSPLPIPTLLFGVVRVPHALGPDPASFAVLRSLHRLAAIVLVGLALGHAGIAIRHHLAGRAVLRRMSRG